MSLCEPIPNDVSENILKTVIMNFPATQIHIRTKLTCSDKRLQQILRLLWLVCKVLIRFSTNFEFTKKSGVQELKKLNKFGIPSYIDFGDGFIEMQL